MKTKIILTALITAFGLFPALSQVKLINTNIQNWTARSVSGNYEQAISVNGVTKYISLTDCIVQPTQSSGAAGGDCSNGRISCGQSAGAVILPEMGNIRKVVIHATSGGDNKIMLVEKQNASGTWSVIRTFITGTSCGAHEFFLNSRENTKLRIRSGSSSSTLYIWDLYVDQMPEYSDISINEGNLQLGNNNDIVTGLGKKLIFSGVNENTDPIWMARYNPGNNESELRINIGDDQDDDDRFVIGKHLYGNEWHSHFIVTNTGKVGINVYNPQHALEVNGTVRAKEIKIESTNWPDYVFAPEYQLPTLEEVSNHIKENKHLPGIPSAKEVEESGVNLGELNAKLLQKIEELTLYVIDLKKEINELKQQK